MNISSIVVRTAPQHVEGLVKILKEAKDCDYHLHDEKGRVIVTIEASGADDEISYTQADSSYAKCSFS